MKPQIELMIFDLGRVLVDFDFKKVVRDLKRFSPKSEAEIKEYFNSTPLWDKFERGHVNPADFFKGLQKDLHLDELTFEAFTPLWNDIFSEKHDTVEILKELRGRYKLAMLSNVNQMHWEYIRDKHHFMGWFDHPVASYAVGLRKPEPEIFHLVLKQAGVPASRALFVDDIESHIDAARAVGIRAHQFITAEQFKSDLQDVLQ